jgi:hypothetical protein
MRPVGPSLAVHNVGRPQRPVSAQLRRTAGDKRAVAKTDLIIVARCHPCTSIWYLLVIYHTPKLHAQHS